MICNLCSGLKSVNVEVGSLVGGAAVFVAALLLSALQALVHFSQVNSSATSDGRFEPQNKFVS